MAYIADETAFTFQAFVAFLAPVLSLKDTVIYLESLFSTYLFL